ncbi:MAG TPA: TAXI family TRAP transporter solute-binding subunit [Pseudolabrys sp.]|jgi:TRAP transporter TAXI family solute receptor|nr:TAXI family TRAP transporter solute-binding subunit [Pseudolabrys sp.]
MTLQKTKGFISLGFAFGIALAFSTPAAAAQVKMMTGPQGGSWIPLGGQLKDLWEKAIPGLNVQVLPGAGMANVRGVDEGKADIGIGNSISTVDGVSGKPPFPRKAENVCNVATLYPQYYQLVVPADAGINSIADLKGKAITTQQRGNTGELITRQLLGVNGIKYSDVKVSFVGYTDSVNQMKDGHAVAFGLGTQVPAGAIMDLAAARDIKMLDQSSSFEAMKKLNPGYTLVTIKKGSYPKMDHDVKVIGYATHIFVSCKLPADEVYTMTKTIAENTKTLSTVAKAIATQTIADLGDDIGVPFHPGAAKFYKEHGVTVASH